jgi:hypothetical protein
MARHKTVLVRLIFLIVLMTIALSSILQALFLTVRNDAKEQNGMDVPPPSSVASAALGEVGITHNGPTMISTKRIPTVHRSDSSDGPSLLNHHERRVDPEVADVTATAANTQTTTTGLFGPQRFNNITNNLARGANLMTSISGCHIAAWVFAVGKERQHRDCMGWRSDHQTRINMQETGPFPDIKPYDTVYVHTKMLTDFIGMVLPRLKVPIVLLSGSYDNTRANRLPHSEVQHLLFHPMIEHWFCQNIINTTRLHNRPPKLDPLALGMEPFDKNPRGPNPVVILRDVILRTAERLPPKSIPVFEAYTSPFTNPNRIHMPRGTKLSLPDYLEQLAKSKFVLSPGGHKPDCFRHYEALALGAIPVTDLDAETYSHLQGGPVVFGTSDWWNLTEAKLLQLMNLTDLPQPNRNMIFEEFWMEDMERRVGRPLRWFDIRMKNRSLLQDLYMNYDDIQRMVDSAWADYSNDSEAILNKFTGERRAWRVKGWKMPYS